MTEYETPGILLETLRFVGNVLYGCERLQLSVLIQQIY